MEDNLVDVKNNIIKEEFKFASSPKSDYPIRDTDCKLKESGNLHENEYGSDEADSYQKPSVLYIKDEVIDKNHVTLPLNFEYNKPAEAEGLTENEAHSSENAENESSDCLPKPEEIYIKQELPDDYDWNCSSEYEHNADQPKIIYNTPVQDAALLENKTDNIDDEPSVNYSLKSEEIDIKEEQPQDCEEILGSECEYVADSSEQEDSSHQHPTKRKKHEESGTPSSLCNKEQHVCPVCQRTFRYLVNMKQHMPVHDPDRRQPVCRLCNKTFTTYRYVKQHMRMHTGDKPHTCEVCGKKFTMASTVKVHMRIHTKEIPFVCGECGRAFGASSRLKRHMRIHTKERPYACKVCGDTFTQSTTVIIHMRTHTKEKPYPCELCDKRFTSSSAAKVHMRTHTKEKPYSCKICGRRFSVSYQVKKHMRTHTRMLAQQTTSN